MKALRRINYWIVLPWMLLAATLFVLMPTVVRKDDLPSFKVPFQSHQPQGVVYDGATYHVIQVEGRRARGSINEDPDPDHETEIMISRDADFFSYGHMITWYAGGSTLIKSVSWESDGVELTFEAGHRLFVPKASFIGGR